MVDEGLRAFNVDRLYGGEIKVDDLVDATATLPMMVPRRVVIVLEAEKLPYSEARIQGRRRGAGTAHAFPKRPPSHATTVFVCGTVDQRRTASRC